VIQLVVSGALPSLPVLRSRCLADPDVLLKISQEVCRSSAPQELSDRFSLVLHDLRMAGVWKRTNRGRLKRSEEMLCTHIPAPLRHDLTFLDIGASDGITTVEALRALRRAFGTEVHAFVTDLNLWLLRYRLGPLVEYRATDGEPIMARLGPFGLRLAKSRREMAADGNPLSRLYLGLEKIRRSMQLDARISLVHPDARSEPGIEILELDCLALDESLVGRIAAIRASNVLNLGYFNVPQIHRALDGIHAYLKEGGCLVVSKANGQPSSQQGEEAENGSVWSKDGRHFRWLQDFGAGSEIRSIVDGWLPS
jgi:hypothetical protein